MAENLNLSARAVAAVLANAKSPKAKREAAEARARAMAAVSKRKAWTHLVAAIDAGDTARIAARATGDWSAVAKEREAKPAPKVTKASPKARKANAAKPETKDALAEAAAAMKAAFGVDVDATKLAAFAAFLAK